MSVNAATAPHIIGLLETFGWTPEQGRGLVVSRAGPPVLSGHLQYQLDWVSSIANLQRDGTTRFSLALVADQLPHLTKADASHLLAELRDRYAERTVVCNEGVLSRPELLALGYIPQDRVLPDGDVYLHDPDEFYARREWNDNKNWANPQNFNKFRW